MSCSVVHDPLSVLLVQPNRSQRRRMGTCLIDEVTKYATSEIQKADGFSSQSRIQTSPFSDRTKSWEGRDSNKV
jgi:hypothetical protein